MRDRLNCIDGCKGNIVKRLLTIDTGWGDTKVRISGASGMECSVCGLRLYSADEVGLMQSVCQIFDKHNEIENIIVNRPDNKLIAVRIEQYKTAFKLKGKSNG